MHQQSNSDDATSEEESSSTEPIPLAVNVGGINRNGIVTLNFNQPIYVPEAYSSRLLCENN